MTFPEKRGRNISLDKLKLIRDQMVEVVCSASGKSHAQRRLTKRSPVDKLMIGDQPGFDLWKVPVKT